MFCTELDLNLKKKKCKNIEQMMRSCVSGAECNKIPEIFLLDKHPNISSEDQDESRRDQEKLDLVELLEAVTYLVCQDNHVVPDTFYKVKHNNYNNIF